MVRTTTVSLVALAAVALLGGCSERDLAELDPAKANDDPVIFDDGFGNLVDYQAFLGSKYDALSIDTEQAFAGTASLKVTVPGPDVTSGTFAGGAFISMDTRDLSGYDALVFFARSSVPSTFNEIGLANDNSGSSLYEARRFNIPLGTDWRLVVLPIPDPSRLSLERGLFFFAEGHEAGAGFTVWFDEVRFARMGTIGDPRPSMATRTLDTFVGATVSPEDTRVTFAVNGVDMTVVHSPNYFDYVSSDEAVVKAEGSVITGVGDGTATVTAKLGTVDATGSITVNVIAPPSVPAPAPDYPAGDVIALLSDAYDEVPVDTWRATWSMSGPVTDLAIGDDAIKAYTGLTYAGIEFITHTIDTADMTHVRMDVWARSGTIFRLKLVDFGADGVYQGAPDSQWELTFNAQSDPAFTAGQWVVLDIPLSRFNLASREHMAQIVISSPNARTVFVDNVLFHR